MWHCLASIGLMTYYLSFREKPPAALFAGEQHFVEQSAHETVQSLKRISRAVSGSLPSATENPTVQARTFWAEPALNSRRQSTDGSFEIAEEYDEVRHGPLRDAAKYKAPSAAEPWQGDQSHRLAPILAPRLPKLLQE